MDLARQLRKTNIPSRLIVLEGIDCSGKTTLSKMLAEYLNEHWMPDSPSQPPNWVHDHEPRFSSTEADNLNIKGIDPWQREYYFMKDRMGHQEFLNTHNVVLDRYILSGLAYAETFSKNVVPMMKSVYSIKREFKEPDLVVLVDMPPEEAVRLNELKKGTSDYSEDLSLNILQTIRDNFFLHLQDLREWEVPFKIVMPEVGNLKETLERITEDITFYV